MDPVTIGVVLLAIVSGAGSQLGTQLWQGVVSLVRRPFHKPAESGDAARATVPPTGQAELAALQQDPGDQHKAIALAEALLARSGSERTVRELMSVLSLCDQVDLWCYGRLAGLAVL